MDTDSGMADLLGIVEDADGLSVQTGEAHTNVSGGVHGGLIATLCDMAMGRAVREAVGEGSTAVTLQLSVTYLNAAEPGDVLRAVAKVGKKGGQVAMLEADVTNGDGTDIAHAAGTFLIKDKD